MVYYCFITPTTCKWLIEAHPQWVHDQVKPTHIVSLTLSHAQALKTFSSFQGKKSVHSICILRAISSQVLYIWLPSSDG